MHTQSKGIETVCWVVSGVIVIVLIYSLLSELLRPPAAHSGGTTAGMRSETKERRRRPVSSRNATPVVPGGAAAPVNKQGPAAVDSAKASDSNTAYDKTGGFMLPRPSDDAPNPAATDTSHYFVDSGADAESFKKTDAVKAMRASNIFPSLMASSDTGNFTSGAARTIGMNVVPWAPLMPQTARAIGRKSTPWLGTDASESARAMLHGSWDDDTADDECERPPKAS